jgi:hypothetical protein
MNFFKKSIFRYDLEKACVLITCDFFRLKLKKQRTGIRKTPAKTKKRKRKGNRKKRYESKEIGSFGTGSIFCLANCRK